MPDYSNIQTLVVDDHKTMVKIICGILEDLGFRNVDTAESGESAIAKIRNKKYDLVLSDWNMEPMDGLQLLKAVRAANEQPYQKVPFILITAESKAENIVAASKAGVDNYVVKPFSKEVLNKKLTSVFQKRGLA